MTKNRDINYNDWTKNLARKEGIWVSYRNPNDSTYYAVRDSGLPSGVPDPADDNRMVYKPMTDVELNGLSEDALPGDYIFNYARSGIRHITKKVLKTEHKAVKTSYRVNGTNNSGPGLKEFGAPTDQGLTYEWSREQNPRGKYLLCIRMTQAYVDKYIFSGQPPVNPEPAEDEAPVPADQREEPLDDNGDLITELNSLDERTKQKARSSAASQIRKAFKLNEMAQQIENAEKVLKEYGKILKSEGISPEDLNGFDITKQTKLYAKSYKKAKRLLLYNSISFDEVKFTAENKMEFVFDSEYNLLHFLYGETSPGRADLEKEKPGEQDSEVPDPASNDSNPEGTFYNAFDRRDLTPEELGDSIPVFLPAGAPPETPANKKPKINNIMLDRTRHQLKGWSSTTLSILANTDKILEQHKNIGTDDLLPWTTFLSQCIYPNPCIKPIKVKQEKEEPKVLTSSDVATTSTASQIGQHNVVASIEVKEKRAEKRKKEFNIVESSTLNCEVDLESMLEDLDDLYDIVLNKFSFKALLTAAAEKAKNEMRNQAAIFTNNVQEGIESEVKKVVDSVVKELECGVDIAKGKLEDKFLSPLKEVPGVNDLLSNFELPEMTFDLPSFEITSFLSFIRQKVEEMAIEMIESMLISMVTEMVQDFIDCEKVIAIDGVDDKGNGLFDAFSKAAFGEANLADIIDPASVRNIAESLGIPENRIDSINNAISEVTTPEELLSLMNGEASEEILRRLSPIINEELQGVANMTIEVLAGYLARIGDTAPEEVKNQIFEAKTETVFCNDLDYQDAADIMKGILGDRAAKEAKAAFDRNKEKLKSLCGLKGDTQDALSQAITEMPIPDKLQEAGKIGDDIIFKSHHDIIAPELGSFSDVAPGDASNYVVYTLAGEYPAVQFGYDGNAQDFNFRLGKWILSVNAQGEQVKFVINNRSVIYEETTGTILYSTPLNGRILPQDAPNPADFKVKVNNVLNNETQQLFTKKVIKNRDDLQKDIVGIYTALGGRKAERIDYQNGINNTIRALYNTISSGSGNQTLKDASKIVNLKYKNMGALAIILRCMLPFIISGFRTVNRAHGEWTPLWFPKDIITNKLVTDYLYHLMFGGGDEWFFISQSGDEYGDQRGGDRRRRTAPLEPTRRNNLTECRIPPNLRPRIKESMKDLYATISKTKIDKQGVIITPGIEAEFDLSDENTAAAKKVISLLLNLFLTHKTGRDRSKETNAEWMKSAIEEFNLGTDDLDVRFPLQALVALVVISGFHDNNGWRQATYVSLDDGNTTINFRKLLAPAARLFDKSFEDDDTELPKL